QVEGLGNLGRAISDNEGHRSCPSDNGLPPLPMPLPLQLQQQQSKQQQQQQQQLQQSKQQQQQKQPQQLSPPPTLPPNFRQRAHSDPPFVPKVDGKKHRQARSPDAGFPAVSAEAVVVAAGGATFSEGEVLREGGDGGGSCGGDGG
ncbi:unnamed protein product, partial [Laminaria digitata]